MFTSSTLQLLIAHQYSQPIDYMHSLCCIIILELLQSSLIKGRVLENETT